MRKIVDDEDLDGHEGYIPGATPEVLRDLKTQEIYNKMYAWSHDRYGDKTNPNFGMWIESLSMREFNALYNIINK